MTVQEIKNAVAHLPQLELNEFRKWFGNFDAGIWDIQFTRDVRKGKLNDLADQALIDLNGDLCTEL
ncbi:MAG: hypothetical protein GY765_00860 [bacterium]|nr:hypothetical protein [bacterium]